MKTLGTAFKQVYGEALKEYGFKKIKGKYPYYVRLIGDEIVHVITYKEEWCIGTNYKAFVVLGGVATIYRKILTFEESPKNNEEWLISNAGVYCKLHPFSDDEEYIKRLRIRKAKLEGNKKLPRNRGQKHSTKVLSKKGRI